MDSRERFYATIEQKPVDRPASWLGIPTKSAIPALLDYFGVEDFHALKIKLNDDIWHVDVPYDNPPHFDIGCSLDFTREHKGGTQDERVLSEAGFFENLTDPSSIETFDWPDPAKMIDPIEALRRVELVPKDKVSMAFVWAAHFQDACSAFGMEQALITAMMNPDMFRAVIDRILEFYLQCGEVFYPAVKGKLDAVAIGNDFGSQTGLMISPEFLHEFVFPGTKQLIEQAKSYGFTVMHHSCGSIYPIVGDIFEMGADIIHPIQALAHDMEPGKLKQSYGSLGAFCGGVDAQELLVNGSPEQIIDKVKELRTIFPTGLIISPSHEAILPDINPANVEAIFEGLKA